MIFSSAGCWRACVLGLVAASLAACGGSGGRSGPTVPVTTSTRTVRVLSGTGLLGVSLDMTLRSGTTVTAVSSEGPLAAGSCAENIETGRVRLGCAFATPANAPFDAWDITFRHAESGGPEILSLTCEGSGSSGSSVIVPCSLN